MPSQTPATPAPAQRKWTDKERKQVAKLLAKGATAAVVAREMGIGRNQALGRIYRDPDLALRTFSRKPKVQRPPRPPKEEKPSSKTPPVAAMVAPAGEAKAPLSPAATVTPPEPPSHPNPMPLIGTGRRWCKWPVAADSRVLGGFLCCGDRSLPNDVYCNAHRKLAAQPPRVRQ